MASRFKTYKPSYVNDIADVLLGLFAATAGLIGNIVIARVNNQNTLAAERSRLESNLILKAIDTGKTSACDNLAFFVGLGYVNDTETIRKTCKSPSPDPRPSLTPPPARAEANIGWDYETGVGGRQGYALATK